MTLKKGEITKQKIIEAAAPIFNQKGYAGTSIDDILTATGLKQGGIYRHFNSKEELAKACFQYAYKTVSKIILKNSACATSAKEELFFILDGFVSTIKNPPFPGGCPVLNTSIDCDDTNEDIKHLVQDAADNWQQRIRDILKRGVLQGEFNTDMDIDEFAITFIATVEGGILLSKLYDDVNYLLKSVNFLKQYFN